MIHSFLNPYATMFTLSSNDTKTLYDVLLVSAEEEREEFQVTWHREVQEVRCPYSKGSYLLLPSLSRDNGEAREERAIGEIAWLKGKIMFSRALAVSFEDISTTLGLGASDLKVSTLNFVNLILGLLGILAVACIIIGAADLVISGRSDFVVVTRARRIMIGGIIGLVVVLLSWAIVNFVMKTTGNIVGVS